MKAFPRAVAAWVSFGLVFALAGARPAAADDLVGTRFVPSAIPYDYGDIPNDVWGGKLITSSQGTLWTALQTPSIPGWVNGPLIMAGTANPDLVTAGGPVQDLAAAPDSSV